MRAIQDIAQGTTGMDFHRFEIFVFERNLHETGIYQISVKNSKPELRPHPQEYPVNAQAAPHLRKINHG